MVKTYKNLYAQIYTWDNLFCAWKKARQGKRYRPATAKFEYNLGTEMLALEEELRTEKYMPSPYTHFIVHEPKRRKISAAPFRDRVVHHALCNIIQPIFERQFIYDSYANQVGKGTHKALDRYTYFARRHEYVLCCDVEQFFPAIDHEILKSILAKSLCDPKIMNLCNKIIDSGKGVLKHEYKMRYFPNDDLFAINRPRGLPIGNLTSQFWANVYLNGLDHFVKRVLKCQAYIRYVDDFVLFHHDKVQLRIWLKKICEFLETLRLTLHQNRAQVHQVKDGVPFLGFVVYPEYRRLKRTKGIRYRRHLYHLYRHYKQGHLKRERLNASVRAWVGHAQHGDTWGLRRHLFSKIIL